MKYVFGPVPSRRLGQSLGVDPIPFKTCNWNCIYCQLGRTSPLLGDRRDYFPPGEIMAEVRNALGSQAGGGIDWVTFVGSGEPTLHASLGTMLAEVKSFSRIPVAVITNGSLLHRSDVREELAVADAVMPTLDAGSDPLYRKINRPMADLSLDRLVEGLMAFRQQYPGKLWVEVMLIKGLNDTPQALADLEAVLARIQPDEVHLSLPVRPPCEPWVEPADGEGIARAVGVLGEVARVVQPAETSLQLPQSGDLAEAILGVITRHPMAEDDLCGALGGWQPAQVQETLQMLAQRGQAQAVERHGKRFWSSTEARYIDPHFSRCHGGGLHGAG